jgi:hypothetical protein
VSQVDVSTLELRPGGGKVRRSRAIAIFLLANWVAMGWLVLAFGLRSLAGGLAFAFGLLALLAGLGQLRGVRLAAKLPLVRLGPDGLEHRPYAGAELRVLDLSAVANVRRSSREELVLALRDGGEVAIQWLALDEDDRRRLESALRARLDVGTPAGAG